MKSKRFVEVLWHDAEGSPGWFDEKAAQETKLPLVTTRGYVVRRTKRDILLAMGYSDGQWLNLFIIPSAMIKKVTRL